MSRYDEDVRWKAVGLRLVDPTANTVAAISSKLGPTRRTLQTWFREAEERNPDLAGRIMPRTQPRQYDRAAILADLEAGNLSRDQIREKHGCSAKFLSQVATGQKPVEEFVSPPLEADQDPVDVTTAAKVKTKFKTKLKTKAASKEAALARKKPQEKRPKGRRT